MVKVLDVIFELINQFKKVSKGTSHYLCKIPENYNTPCFLYLLSLNKSARETKYVQDVMLDFDVIYFNTKDEYNQDDYVEKLKIADDLKEFLNTFMLKVKDRVLKFDYSLDESDGQLTIYITFKFKDNVVNIEDEYELIRDILINGKEV